MRESLLVITTVVMKSMVSKRRYNKGRARKNLIPHHYCSHERKVELFWSRFNYELCSLIEMSHNTRRNEWENYREIKFETRVKSSVMMATKLKIFFSLSKSINFESEFSGLCVCCHSEIDQIYTQFTLLSYLGVPLKLFVSLNCESSVGCDGQISWVVEISRLTFFLSLLGNHQHVNWIIDEETKF
jgi:hypothetical protein